MRSRIGGGGGGAPSTNHDVLDNDTFGMLHNNISFDDGPSVNNNATTSHKTAATAAHVKITVMQDQVMATKSTKNDGSCSSTSHS